MKLSIYTYKFPFAKPFHTATQRFNNRKGIYLTLQKKGIKTLGEAAPLPGFSAENISTVLNEIQKNSENIFHHFTADFSIDSTIKFLTTHDFSPSLQFGLYSLAASHLAQRNNKSLQDFLFADKSSRIPVNAVIGQEKIDDFDHAARLLSNNYKTFKLKAGRDWQKLIQLTEYLRTKDNSLNIRVDANQSWTLKQAQKYLSQLESYKIEYCEEPLAQPKVHTLTKLKDSTSVPIALDESISHTFTLKEAIEIAPVVIIKPMVLGLQAVIESLQDYAQKQNTAIVFTTSLDSSPGRLMTATLASGLGSSNVAHGLATAQLLADDLWGDDEFVDDGHFNLPDAKRFSELMHTNLANISVDKVGSYD